MPRKDKELLAAAIALTAQCPCCIEGHRAKAREVGVSDPEMAETLLVAAAIRAGGAVTHRAHAMKEA
ncbi:MAG TPA: carboxymuconolactone decarboxylase family protein [Nitrospira sp.]|nr:carboxymuconolactone decarboxylase family protein [Nitrospira sp.]